MCQSAATWTKQRHLWHALIRWQSELGSRPHPVIGSRLSRAPLHALVCDWLSRLYAPFLGACGISSCFISSKNRLHYLCARVISVSRRFLSFLFQNKSSKHLIRSLKNHEKNISTFLHIMEKIIEIYWKTRDPKYLDHNKTSLVASIE